VILGLQGYLALSLSARLAVALHCFHRYCQVRGLTGPDIDAFLEHMWQFPCISGHARVRWERERPVLVDVGLGDRAPPALVERLARARVAPREFRALLASTVDIVFGSLYGAADYHASLQRLGTVLRIAARANVLPPPPASFSNSRFEECRGWGPTLSPRERDVWRYQAYVEDHFERF
jgi:hypothetical protein